MGGKASTTDVGKAIADVVAVTLDTRRR